MRAVTRYRTIAMADSTASFVLRQLAAGLRFLLPPPRSGITCTKQISYELWHNSYTEYSELSLCQQCLKWAAKVETSRFCKPFTQFFQGHRLGMWASHAHKQMPKLDSLQARTNAILVFSTYDENPPFAFLFAMWRFRERAG